MSHQDCLSNDDKEKIVQMLYDHIMILEFSKFLAKDQRVVKEFVTNPDAHR